MLNNLSGRWRALVAGAAVMLAMGSGNAVAQSTRGSLAGTVRDAQGAAVPGATVELTSPRRNDTQVTTANEAGDFVFLNLLPDTYNLKVTMDSFKTVEQSNVVLNAADRLSVGVIVLELGAVSETVNVSTRVVEVQSRDATRNFSVDSAAIENLAVNGRDPLVLARLAPGIADVAAGGVGMNVNGGRDNTTNYTVDGVSNLDTGNNGVLGSINLDAVEEFKILTNAYSAEYGRSSGAQVSLVTKSGGRDYRGSVYGYRRQESFNANTFINNRERGRALADRPDLEGRPQADQPADRRRLHGRRPGAARRLQQGTQPAVLLLRLREPGPQHRRRPTRTGSRCRPRSSARATSRSRSTTTTGPTT